MYINTITNIFTGHVKFKAEGYYIEKFINSCRAKNLNLENIKREKNTIIIANIKTKKFKELCKIAKQSKCKIKICKKNGLPFIIHRYKKRKIFVIALIIVVITLITLSNFIWNVDIIGNKNISKEEILDIVKSEGLDIGKLKGKVDAQKIVNKIRIERQDISWVRNKNYRYKC